MRIVIPTLTQAGYKDKNIMLVTKCQVALAIQGILVYSTEAAIFLAKGERMAQHNIPGAPGWLNKLAGVYHGYDEFSKMFLAGAGDFARTQVATGLNNASGNLGRMNENLQQLGQGISNLPGDVGAFANRIGTAFTNPYPSSQNFPGVQTLSRALEVIPQQLRATYGAAPISGVQGSINSVLNNPALLNSMIQSQNTGVQGTIQGALNNPSIVRHFMNSVQARPASAALPGGIMEGEPDPRSRFLPVGGRRPHIPNPGPMKPKIPSTNRQPRQTANKKYKVR